MPAVRIVAILFVTLLPTAPLRAALPSAPHEDIHFVAEHLPESGQDARYLSLPWPGAPPVEGTWETTLTVGWVSTSAGFWSLDGSTVAASALRGIRDRWGLLVIGHLTDLHAGGDTGENVLGARFLRGVPLDLPERARFTDPRGDVRQAGIGIFATRKLGAPGREDPWTLSFGLLLERLEADGLEVDYELLGGADARTRGVLDHSSRADFVTPIVEIQRWRPLGERWALVPRALVGAPLPPGDFDGRLTGPGFDLSTARGDGSPEQIGDAFVGLGLGVVHRPSGVEIDLGSSAFYPLFESVTHDGIDRALLLQLAWHGR